MCCGFVFDFLLADFKRFYIDVCTLVGVSAVPVIPLGDGFAHVFSRGVFVFSDNFSPLNFLGFWGEDDIEGVFGVVSHHQGDFGAVEIGVGEDEFVGAGS